MDDIIFRFTCNCCEVIEDAFGGGVNTNGIEGIEEVGILFAGGDIEESYYFRIE